MIYCVVPEELAGQLFDKLATYYADDDNVKVIINRRHADRRDRGTGSAGGLRQRRDRRRPRVPGEFPAVEAS